MTEKSATVGVGVIGLGFMGRTHLQAYGAARAAGYDCNLVAVCDEQAARLGDDDTQSGCDPRSVRTYIDADRLLADDDVTLVSICTPTDTHVDLAVRALRAGKHVLVEKPVAIRSADVQRLADEAASGQMLCTPAMCMRFWPGWTWLKERIDQGTYGKVQRAVFQRLGAMPDWSPAFYADTTRSGGALMDLHIHDADFVRWCFGDPAGVTSTGSINHVTTIYHYPAGPSHVVAEGGWLQTPGFEFRMRYTVTFDTATAEFDLLRDPQLLITHEGRTSPVSLDPLTGYDHQIRHLLAAITDGGRDLRVTLSDAVAVTLLLEDERRSVEQ
ncbi:MAG: Gfo/Idh/MocA family oxidoreductase [Planctomycetes bacterium]|nr:Gfo/Idh/MocA family oxidoreductase [Planctomycetota bacterium]